MSAAVIDRAMKTKQSAAASQPCVVTRDTLNTAQEHLVICRSILAHVIGATASADHTFSPHTLRRSISFANRLLTEVCYEPWNGHIETCFHELAALLYLLEKAGFEVDSCGKCEQAFSHEIMTDMLLGANIALDEVIAMLTDGGSLE